MANLVSGSFKSTNVNDGADARLLMLETSGNVIGFDAEGKAVPGQKVDIVAYIQNIEGSPVFTAIPYIGETAQTPITLKGSGNARYITGEEWNKDWNRLIVSVSLAGFTDSTTIAKVQDGSGKDGQNAIVGLLTNEAITLSADENGNIPDFSTATGEFQIYDGLTKVTEGVSFAISGQVGASGTINQNGVYNVTVMTADTATIEFKATYKGIEIVKKLSLAKSRKGQPGKNANLLYLSVSNNVIVFDANDVAFPNQRISIVAKLQNISGTATFKAIPYINATAQPEIALSGSGNDRYISGENWDKRWTSLSVTATIGGLSDQTTIYKISEVKGADGKNTIIGILTNESITISADANGNVPDFTKATGTFQIYDGIALVDPKNVTYAVQTQTGATATIGTNGVYRVTAMSADTATVVFKATYGGAERTKQLSIAKSKAGQKGEAGNGIKSTKTQYQRSADGQTPPTGTWLDEIPVVPPGEFLWTRVTQTFDDNTASVSYSVSKMGEDGEKGKDSYVHTMFANDIDFGNYDYSGNPNLMKAVDFSKLSRSSSTILKPFEYVKDHGAYFEIDGNDPSASGVSRNVFIPLITRLQKGSTYIATIPMMISEDFGTDFGGSPIYAYCATDESQTQRPVFMNPNESCRGKWQYFKKTFTVPTDMIDGNFAPFLQIYQKPDLPGKLYIGYDIKIEKVTSATDQATPYQPNLIEEPYQISREPLGENIADPTKSFPYSTSSYNIYLGKNTEKYEANQKYIITMKATKASAKSFGVYLLGGSLGVGNMTPVEGLTDTWQLLFTVTDAHINAGVTDVLSIYQSPQSINGSVKVEWIKLEKAEVWTPNIDAFKYVGFYTGELAEAPSDPTMYKWNKIKGEDGVGLESTEIFYVGSTNGQTPPESGWQTTVPNVPQGQYMWTKVVWTYSDNSIKTAYSVGKIGANGTNGNDGLPGKDGVGIDDTLIEYAVSTSGTVRPTSGWSTNTPSVPQGQYLWTRITWTYTDNTTEQGYIVARQGANGTNGKDGVSVKTIATTYQAGTSGTTPPTGAWLPTPPAVAENQFLWTKIEISLDDGTKSTGYSVGKMGAQGQPGEKGDPGAPGTPGNGIKSSSVTYQVSTSGTTTPTGTWVSTPPTVPQGQYLWTRTVLTFDNGQSVTAYAVSKAGIDGENGLNNDNMVFNSRFEKFNEWPQNSMGWYKTQFTQATQPETDKPTNNILKIGGDASSASRYTFSRNIAVVPGTTIELSFDAKLSRLFTNKSIATIRMFDAEHANSSNQPDTVGGNSYINLFTDGTASAGAGVTEYDGKNAPITTANTWYRYKVRFLVPDNVTNVKMFFTTTDPNASSFLFVRDPQGVIYKDLNANTRNFALDSRFPSAKTIGGTTTRRKNIQLSRPTKAGEKYTIALDYSLISGTLTSQIQVFLRDKNEAGKGNVLLNTSGNKNRLVGEITATGEADHLQIFHGVNGATTEATNYEFEKIMFNLGDKTFDYEQAPEDGFSTTNVWPNSSWNIGKGSWVFTDDQFEILEPETDKPESSILHGKPINLSYQQAYQMPHPRFVNAGDIVHVSFDYKEKNRTKDTLLAIIRIFPEKDTANSGANALAEKPIKPSVLGWSLANNTDWVNVDYVFRSTVSGWLEVLMYDDDVTGNHESFYREIFVTNAGKLHGEWSPAQVDFATQIDGIPKVFVQANMPTDPSIKNGDQWWVQSGNKVTSIKVYGNGAWHDQAIDQAVLNIVQLNAVNINGSVVNGSQFINTFDIKDSDHSKMKGTTKIQDGFIMQDVENIGLDASGAETRKFLESHLRLSYGSFLSQSTLFDDQGNQTSNSSSNLTGGYLNLTLKDSSGTYNGTLDAKALTNTGWKTFRLGPLFEVKEGNPPQYRIFYQLDGSKLVKFRGQFGLKSGTMKANGTYYPFKAENNASSGENYVPAEITPDVTAFGYGATNTAQGGRLAATTSRNILLFPASDATYCSIEGFQYIIER
nr:MAG TPA: tail protein [Caudoviricetes sp.]